MKITARGATFPMTKGAMMNAIVYEMYGIEKSSPASYAAPPTCRGLRQSVLVLDVHAENRIDKQQVALLEHLRERRHKAPLQGC